MFHPNYMLFLYNNQVFGNWTRQKRGFCSMGLTEKQKETLKNNNEESNRITRESIRGALYILMKQKDFSKITISEIIQRSGASRSAFYRNFAKKEDIILDSLNHIWNMLVECASNSVFDNWEATFQLFRRYKNEVDVVMEAGLEHYLLIKLNESLNFGSNLDYKLVMYNGIAYNVIICWINSGMPGTDHEAASKIVEAYQKIKEEL